MAKTNKQSAVRGNNCAIVSRSGYIWIWSGARDQESTNHRVHFVEWKSSFITKFIVVVIICYYLTFNVNILLRMRQSVIWCWCIPSNKIIGIYLQITTIASNNKLEPVLRSKLHKRYKKSGWTLRMASLEWLNSTAKSLNSHYTSRNAPRAFSSWRQNNNFSLISLSIVISYIFQ